MKRRQELADWLNAGGVAELRHSARKIPAAPLGALLDHGLGLVELLLDDVRRLLRPWGAAKLPQQWRITDVRREHILFTGDEVTGVVDFGAANFDSPAGDVARLLGSMAGDGQKNRAAAIAAYTQHRPLSRDELSAIAVFDVSGVCLSLANWARWVAEADPSRLSLDAPRIAVRLEQLNARMEGLARSGLAGFAPPL